MVLSAGLEIVAFLGIWFPGVTQPYRLKSNKKPLTINKSFKINVNVIGV